MLGLGETADEVHQAMRDLRDHGVDLLTLGQYLRPTLEPPARSSAGCRLKKFEQFRQAGLNLGFTEVAAGPLVRSSYRADRILDGNNLGISAAPEGQISVRQID